MPDDGLTPNERATLLILMVEGREVSNPELQKRYGFTLVGDERKRLNSRSLVDSHMEGRCYVHELTDKGWRWCREEPLELPAGSRTETALYAVVGGVRRLLPRANLIMAEVFQPEEVPLPKPEVAPSDIEARIRSAYLVLAKKTNGWVSLTELRPLLTDAAREAVDEALRRMERLPRVHVIPEENRKVLTPEDQAAAIRIGGEDKHLIAIDEP